MEEPNSEIIIYQNSDGNIKIDVLLVNETVWLTRQHMALVFNRDVKTIGKHISNVFSEGEQKKLEHEESLEEIEEDIKNLKRFNK